MARFKLLEVYWDDEAIDDRCTATIPPEAVPHIRATAPDDGPQVRRDIRVAIALALHNACLDHPTTGQT